MGDKNCAEVEIVRFSRGVECDGLIHGRHRLFEIVLPMVAPGEQIEDFATLVAGSNEFEQGRLAVRDALRLKLNQGEAVTKLALVRIGLADRLK